MDQALRYLLRYCGVLAITLLATTATAQQRLAVLELFGRATCSNCQAAGEALTALQPEMEGRAVLLDYDIDRFSTGQRIVRFDVAEPNAPYLPLVMVGSGFQTSSGWVTFDQVYRDMLDAELARPATAEIAAYQRRSGDGLRVYVQVEHLGPGSITRSPTLWVIPWENAPIGVGPTWVHSATRRLLATPLEPGVPVQLVIDTLNMADVDWSRTDTLVLFEHYDAESRRYDMQQAVMAQPAALLVTPERLSLSLARPVAELSLSGPHVMEWTATPEVPWLQVSPASGTLPAEVTVRLLGKSGAPGTVRFDASGGGMSFSVTVDSSVEGSVRRVTRRVSPAQS